MIRGGDTKRAIAKGGRTCVPLVKGGLDDGYGDEGTTRPRAGRLDSRRAR